MAPLEVERAGRDDDEPAAAPESEASSSYSFRQEERSQGNAQRKRRDELTNLSIQDFIGELRKVRRAAPRGG